MGNQLAETVTQNREDPVAIHHIKCSTSQYSKQSEGLLRSIVIIWEGKHLMTKVLHLVDAYR